MTTHPTSEDAAADAYAALLQNPLVVVLYRTVPERDALVRELAGVWPSGKVMHTSNVEDALGRPGELVVLRPSLADEADTLQTLEERRSGVLQRTQPLLLTLFQGAGAASLLDAHVSLGSVVRGAVVYPQAELDIPAAVAAFEREHGPLQRWVDAAAADGPATAREDALRGYAWFLRKAMVETP